MTFIISILMFLIIGVKSKNVLVVIDVQDCFLRGGSLAVSGGNDIIPIINNIRDKYNSKFDLVVFSQDWHCSNHVSFASQHVGYNPYQIVNLMYNYKGELCIGESVTNSMPYAVSCGEVAKSLAQTLWPDHCVKNVSTGSTSSMLDSTLTMKDSDIIIYKGLHCDIDAYSVFYDNGKITQTRLNSVLKDNGITDVYITGLATDYCVYYSAMDSKVLGYNTFVITDATRGVANTTIIAALKDMKDQGITLIESKLVGIQLSVNTGTVVNPVPVPFCFGLLLSILQFMF